MNEISALVFFSFNSKKCILSEFSQGYKLLRLCESSVALNHYFLQPEGNNELMGDTAITELLGPGARSRLKKLNLNETASMQKTSSTNFVPMLYIPAGTTNIDFYKKTFGAIEIRRWSNEDGSIHVIEFSVDGALFHLHEEKASKRTYCPEVVHGVTANIGLMVEDVDRIMKQALEAGAREISPAQDYDYGYRQGEFIDPFGHLWTIEKVI
jgi:PhnB protein